MLDIEKIYEENFEAILKYLLCLTHDHDLSEELTQETFYKAVQKISLYKGDCEISAWLCRIAKNLWYDYYKKNKRIIHISDEDLSNIEEATSTDNLVILEDEKNELYRRLQNIDKTSRDVVYLRITGELSFKEIGIILNKSENWARVTYFRAKRKLKEADSNEKK